MQTFLPYGDFDRTAAALDYRRLGKQRVEAFQILKTLEGGSQGWRNHPAVLMWRGYESSLRQYMRVMILEWVRRGYRNTMKVPRLNTRAVPPSWLGDASFHVAHRSNLVRKDPVFYGGKWPELLGTNLPYVWPVQVNTCTPSLRNAVDERELAVYNKEVG